jgi:hypothetical protein
MAFRELVNPTLKNMRAETYSSMLQEIYQANSVIEQVASTTAQSELGTNQTYHRASIDGFFSGLKKIDAGQDIPKSPLGAIDETLTIDRYFGDRFEIPEVQSELERFNLRQEFGALKMRELALQIDGDCLGHMAESASIQLDAGDFGGNAGEPLRLAAGTIEDIVPAIKAELSLNKVSGTDMVGIITPEFVKILTSQTQGRATEFGDAILRNGFMSGEVLRHQGFTMYESVNVPVSLYLDMTGNAVDGQTVSINGATVTFKDVVAAKGQVAIGADAVETMTNLKNFFENPTSGDFSHVAYNAESDHSSLVPLGFGSKFEITVTDQGAGAAEVKFFMLGGNLRIKSTLAETLTNGSWNSDKHSQHIIFTKRGGIELVRAIAPKTAFVSADANMFQQSEIVKLTALYGRKVFADQKQSILSLRAAL